MSRAIRFRSSSTAWRLASKRLLIDQAAVVQRERRLLRASASSSAWPPAPLAVRVSDARERDPAERLRRQAKRSHEQRLHVRRAIECAHRFGQAASSSPSYSRIVVAALLRVAQMPAHALARQVQRPPSLRCRPSASRRAMFAIHRSQLPLGSSISHTPHACALGIIHEPLDEHAEEAAQIWMRDQQIERELNRIASEWPPCIRSADGRRAGRCTSARSRSSSASREGVVAERNHRLRLGGVRHVSDYAASRRRCALGRPAGRRSRPFGRWQASPNGRWGCGAFDGCRHRLSAGL